MTEPVSLAKLKDHLRVFHTLQDDLITDLGIDARELIEKDTWLTLVPVTKTCIRRSFPTALSAGAANYPNAGYPGNAFQSGTYPNSASIGMRGRADAPLYLPGPPLRSITSITYLDENGATQTLSSYRVMLNKNPGWIEPAFGQTWPTTLDDPNAVTIVYQAGYDDENDNSNLKGHVPNSLKRAIKLIASEAYEHAEPVEIKGRSTVDRILEKFRIRHAGLLDSV